MGAGARNRAKEKRKKEKQAEKARKAALYASFKEQGKTKLSKRFTAKQKRGATAATKHRHLERACGNPACKRCFGVSYAGFVDANGVPKKMPQYMFLIWKEDNKDKHEELLKMQALKRARRIS